MPPKFETPAVADYPTPQPGGPHHELLERTRVQFLDVVGKVDGFWEDQGERNGVALSKHPNPSDAWAVPAVRGSCVIEGVTTNEVLATIQQPGMRKVWDSRFEDAWMLNRYDRTSYLFYTSMFGIGWLVYPRTIVGVQGNFVSAPTPNSSIVVIQVSAPPDGTPNYPTDEPGKVRAQLRWSGWKIEPRGEGHGVQVTYAVDISLEGSIPAAMVTMVATEIPTCCGKVRDIIYENGFCPYSTPPPGQADASVIFQTEEFNLPTKTWHSILTGMGSPADFLVQYDAKRMYTSGAKMEVQGPGKDHVQVQDDGKGTVEILVGEGAKGLRFDLFLTPK